MPGRPQMSASDFVSELRGIVGATKEVAVEEELRESTSCLSTYENFKDYCCNKAFEVIGDDNQYKRYFSQCKENADAWAIKVHAGVQQVMGDIKSVQAMVETLQTQGKEKLYRLCLEVMTSSAPPVRRKNGWFICSISGARSDMCVEVGRQGKDAFSIVVHQKFTPFILYLWFCCKIEHIVKNQVRLWVGRQDTDEVDRLCRLFQEDDALVQRWYSIFCCSVAHVKLSILMESRSHSAGIS